VGFDVGFLVVDLEDVGLLEVGFDVLGFSVDLMSFGIHDLIVINVEPRVSQPNNGVNKIIFFISLEETYLLRWLIGR